MTKYVESNGRKFCIDFYCVIEGGKTTAAIYEITKNGSNIWFRDRHLSVYYRHERTLDDHMGNTPCGYFVNFPLPTGERKRVYMF